VVGVSCELSWIRSWQHPTPRGSGAVLTAALEKVHVRSLAASLRRRENLVLGAPPLNLHSDKQLFD
jgi:hypothetical protein